MFCCLENEQWKYLEVRKWPAFKRKSNNWRNTTLPKKLQQLRMVFTGAL